MGCGDFAVVPAQLIEEGSEACFLTSHRRGAEVVAHTVANGIALISEITLQPSQPSVETTHASSANLPCHEIEPLLVESLNRKDNCVNVALYDGRLYVVVMQRGSLLMANRYKVACGEDVLYHVLNAYQGFGLDVLHDPLYVYGIDTALIKKYIAHIETVRDGACSVSTEQKHYKVKSV